MLESTCVKELEQEEDMTESQQFMPFRSRRLCFFLIGTTGHGKSSTGNSILRESVFKTNSSFEPTESPVKIAVTEFNNYMIQVVDGPGLDCDVSRADILQEILTREMVKALACANNTVIAFLLVMRFGSRFTSEDFKLVVLLDKFLHGEVLKRLIVVVTGGDDFRDCEDDEKCSFQEWCSRQTGAFRKLLVTCEDRCVLFDNKEKDEFKRLFQVQELLKVGLNLQQSCGPFLTPELLKDLKESETPIILNPDQRKKWRKEVGTKPSMSSENETIKDICEKLREVANDFEDCQRVFQDLQKFKQIRSAKWTGANLTDLHKQRRKDVGTKSSLSSRNEIVEDTSEKLKELALEIEDSQEVKQIWSKIGTGATLAGGALALVLPVLGALVAATGVVSVIAGRRQIDEKIERIKSTQREILRENNLPFETQEAKKTK